MLAGFVSPGETPEEAVVREVREESENRGLRSALRDLPAVALSGLADARFRRLLGRRRTEGTRRRARAGALGAGRAERSGAPPATAADLDCACADRRLGG
ncbi:MAG: NUDIX domain-containing protein [Solirubrobacteraceae bacterium]